MASKLFIGKLIKKGDRAEYKNRTDLELFQYYVSKMRQGQVVSIIIDFEGDDGTLEQIAKVHAMLRELARETGEMQSKLKIDIKKECDLRDLNGELKSFGDCSKEELSDVIKQLIEWGNMVGLKLD